jgi:hypothetical protein
VNSIVDFFGSAAGVEILRIIDSVGTIVAAILSGAALNNAIKVKKAIGGTIEQGIKDSINGWLRKVFRRRRRASATLVQPPPMTVVDQIEGLKNTYERNWVAQGIKNSEVDRRLDRIDPHGRKH